MEPVEKPNATRMDVALRDSLIWRSIGPHRGGRVVAVTGVVGEPHTYYFGACAGGVWKTTDGGTTWGCVSDSFFTTAAVGAIAASESDPKIIYVGTGESTIRNNVSHGDGVYKSTDGGETWAHIGLTDTRHIAKIRIHPQNPDIVYVAALGHAFGPNAERGIFRSKDGGATWERVLFRGEDTGACDLTMDPHNPQVLYAALWQVRRTPWSLASGGPGSGLFKSADGGDTWVEITRNPGLPQGVIGKIGVAVSPAQPGRIWALAEAEDGALFRSDDGGATWQRLSEARGLRSRPWYYMHIFADPQDADTVFILNGAADRSTDGGTTFEEIPTPHGDNHDLWIDPRDPQRMIEGNDGGACVSVNGGATWSTLFNQPTAQFYHVAADNRTPYYLYAAQQDSSALCLPSWSRFGAITMTEWEEPGGGETGYLAFDPDAPEIIYGGANGSGAGNGRLIRFDRRSGQERNVTVWPELNGMGSGAEELRYRFTWTFPMFLSVHDRNTLYVASNVVHRSRDGGANWEVISPDLTRNDPTKLGPSGGPISNDNTGAEVYCTISALAESPHEQGVFWAGSDDGLIHLSRDGGENWEDVTPKDIPEWALISVIEPSPHDPATVYVAATRYKLDDNTPYLLKTNDYGATWTMITEGIRADDFTRVIRADPNRRGLLYCGTETGVYLSFDDGDHWRPLQGGRSPGSMPVCPVYDLIVKGMDLIVATHGRGLWILDDLGPLQQYRDEMAEAAVHLFAPRDHTRMRLCRTTVGRVYTGYGSDPRDRASYRDAGPVTVAYLPGGATGEILLNAGANPPNGAIVHYYLRAIPVQPVTLTFLDAEGHAIRTFTSADAAEETWLNATPGLHRFVWDMRYPGAVRIPGDTSTQVFYAEPGAALLGPLVVPGVYRVRLTCGAHEQSATFTIQLDPRVAVSRTDLEAQRDLLLGIRDALSDVHTAVLAMRSIREQAALWHDRGGEVAAAGTIIAVADEIEDVLIQRDAANPRGLPIRLNAKLAGLTDFVAGVDAAPTRQAHAVFNELRARIAPHLAATLALITETIPPFNDLAAADNAPVITVMLEGADTRV